MNLQTDVLPAPRLCRWTALVALLAGASAPTFAARALPLRTPPLEIVVIDWVGLSPETRRSASREIQSVFGDIGAVLQFSFLTPDGATELPAVRVGLRPRLAVTVQLWQRDGTFLRASPLAMGVVILGRKPVNDTAHVFFPVVVRAMTREQDSAAGLTSLELGRALGRVIAHELVHTFVPRLPHSPRGIMQRSLSRELLRQLRPVTLDRSSADALHRALETRRQFAEARTAPGLVGVALQRRWLAQ